MPDKNNTLKKKQNGQAHQGAGFWKGSWFKWSMGLLVILVILVTVLLHGTARLVFPGGQLDLNSMPTTARQEPSATPPAGAASLAEKKTPVQPQSRGFVRVKSTQESSDRTNGRSESANEAKNQPLSNRAELSRKGGPHMPSVGQEPDSSEDTGPGSSRTEAAPFKIASTEFKTEVCSDVLEQMENIEHLPLYSFVPVSDAQVSLECDDQESALVMTLRSRRYPWMEPWSSLMPKKRKEGKFYLKPGEAASYFFDSLKSHQVDIERKLGGAL